jgi:S-DNA-T family DNA segregation ATPase FtsK/SpoIIIE
VIKAQVEDYKLPYVEFLNAPPPHREQADDELLNLATRLAEKCREFNVTGQIKHICPGPVVTTYEFKPDPGVKYARVTGLVDDLCLAMKAESIRIDRMPGKPHVGIEVPNPRRETIHLREVIESRAFRESNSKLTIALGKTIDGLNYVTDLAKMPHLLIAGTTGAGKSVGVNALLLSILYNARPDEVKFILIDPKRLELGLYEDIPHLAAPIITDPKLAARALRWAVAEMERRYKQLAGWGVRNIDGFNMEILRRNTVKDFDENGEAWKPLPFIVIIIDELADLMMVSGHEVEESITRLAQMARAVGIHLVLATQPVLSKQTSLREFPIAFPRRSTRAPFSTRTEPSSSWVAATCFSCRRALRVWCGCTAPMWTKLKSAASSRTSNRNGSRTTTKASLNPKTNNSGWRKPTANVMSCSKRLCEFALR